MDTNKHKLPDSVKELLQSPSFVLWCYSPTEENAASWNEWIKQNPEREQDATQARAILLSVEFNNIPFSIDDSKNLYSRIEASVYRRRKQRKRRLAVYSIAAASLIFIIFSFWWQNLNDANIPGTFIPFESIAVIDSIQTEIELELVTQEKVSLADNTVIKISEEGAIHIEDEVLNEKPIQQEDTHNTTNTEMNMLKVPRGRHTMISLADGSRVWVNSETILQFPAVFDKNHRTIYADGEIYLEVAKDNSRPFYVKTSRMDIQVLGTSFNVTAYKDDASHSVVLREGAVEINTANGIKRSIQPNDRLVLEDERIDVSTVNPYYFFSWIDGVFLFEKQSLKDIAQRLSRHYRVNFVCAPDVQELICNGKLVLFEDIQKVLRTLEEGLPVSCQYDGNTVNINPKQ